MDLPLDGREYARWTVDAKHDLSEVPPPQVRISTTVDGAETWADWANTTWLAAQIDRGDSKYRRVAGLLVKGPDFTGSIDGLELAAGSHSTRSRVDDNPETVVRDTDEITVG